MRVLSTEAGERLDAVLARRGSASRSRYKALIRQGEVRVNGARVTEADHRVNADDVVDVAAVEPREAEPKPEPIPLAVVHEDDFLIVVDKPAGLVVHPAAGNWTGTLVNALLAHCGASLSGIGGVRRPGIVHRLDKDTSGLLVAAKTDAAHRALAAQFADHGREGPLERGYVALAWGAPRERAGTIDAPLGRDPRNREKRTVSRGADARRAVTHYEVEETFGPNGEASLLACRLETGRTHQIRVHMAHLRHPLVGDALYGAGFRTKADRLPPRAAEAAATLGRQALHAGHLAFAHPDDGRRLRFDSAPPQDMAVLIAALREWE